MECWENAILSSVSHPLNKPYQWYEWNTWNICDGLDPQILLPCNYIKFEEKNTPLKPPRKYLFSVWGMKRRMICWHLKKHKRAKASYSHEISTCAAKVALFYRSLSDHCGFLHSPPLTETQLVGTRETVFFVVASCLWNSFSLQILQAPSLKGLKMFGFRQA